MCDQKKQYSLDLEFEEFYREIVGKMPMSHIRAYNRAHSVIDLLEDFAGRCLEDQRWPDFKKLLALRQSVRRGQDLLSM